MKRYTLAAACLSIFLLCACDPEEIVTGQKNYSHVPSTSRTSYSGTYWQDALEVQDLCYSEGTITAAVTNKTGHDISCEAVIQWQVGTSTGKDQCFLKLKAGDSGDFRCVDWSLDEAGDTDRILKIESIAIGDWDSEEEYFAEASGKSDLQTTLDSYAEKLKSLLGG